MQERDDVHGKEAEKKNPVSFVRYFEQKIKLGTVRASLSMYVFCTGRVAVHGADVPRILLRS